IVVLKQTAPNTCGGTDATLDRAAPKEIASDALIWFDGDCVLPYKDVARRDDGSCPAFLGYVHAFAAAAGEDTFLLLETGDSFHGREERKTDWALIRGNKMPDLARLIRDLDLARQNGYHSQTHGLPENFGGAVRASYATGETISFADNQGPILSREQGEALADWFTSTMAGERVPLPALDTLTAVRFEEKRENGGFTEAVLTLADGRVARRSRYDDPTVYESEKTLDADAIAALKDTVAQTGLLAWERLPAREFAGGREKTLAFTFADGSTVTVRDDRVLPGSVSRGFFEVELPLTSS
ncbi:MAG: hypothetical protein J6X61_01805, partial [Clostridia bacterium]|nr:hypothetical protein [Clostridia bacterium]